VWEASLGYRTWCDDENIPQVLSRWEDARAAARLWNGGRGRGMSQEKIGMQIFTKHGEMANPETVRRRAWTLIHWYLMVMAIHEAQEAMRAD